MNPIDPGSAMEPIRERPSGPDGDRLAVGRVFALFASAWPRINVSEATLNLWASQLTDVPADVALEAAEACVRSCEFWPSVRTYLDAVKAVKVNRSRTVFVALPEARDVDLARTKVAEIRAALNQSAGSGRPEGEQP